jgi:hypothetical protein
MIFTEPLNLWPSDSGADAAAVSQLSRLRFASRCSIRSPVWLQICHVATAIDS